MRGTKKIQKKGEEVRVSYKRYCVFLTDREIRRKGVGDEV